MSTSYHMTGFGVSCAEGRYVYGLRDRYGCEEGWMVRKGKCLDILRKVQKTYQI